MGAGSGTGRTLPTPARRVGIAGCFLAVYGVAYVLVVLVRSRLFDQAPDWTGPLGPLIGAALGSGLVVRWQRRRMGGSERVREFTRAVRRRRLPEGADPAVWGPLLDRERRTQRRLRAILLPVTGLIFAGASVSAIVAGLGWFGATAMLLAGVVLVALLWLVSRRTVARVDHLADQLVRD